MAFLLSAAGEGARCAARALAVRPMVGIGAIRAIQAALLFLSLSVLVAVPSFAAAQNLLLNGDLSAGSGGTPEHWRITSGARPGSYRWSHVQGAPTLEIATVKAYSRDIYCRQAVTLAQPGWYYLRAEVRTEDSSTRSATIWGSTKAALRIWGPRWMAVAIQSNRNWAPMEAFFKVGNANETVQIGCGLRAMSAGRAFFRNLRLNRISGSPPPGSRELKISQISYRWVSDREMSALGGVELALSPPEESLLSDVLNFHVVVEVFVVLVTLTYLDWRYSNDASGRDTLRKFFQDREVRKSAVVAVFICLTLLGTWLVARVEYLPGLGFYVVERHAVSGDEPHYLVMINSLLFNHDLQLQTLYDDVERGGPEGGVIASERRLHGDIILERHTIVVNQVTGHRAMGTMKNRNPEAEFAPSPDVYEIPVHPAGFPMLMALAVAPMQPRAREVEPDVGFILMLVAWLGIVATYLVGRQVGMGRGWSMLAASMLFAASPWLAYSRAYFAESSIGLALILGLWALVSDLPILAALAAAAAAIMKPGFALVGAGFLVEEVREKRWKDAIKIGLVLGLPALEFLASNFWLHRRFLVLSLEPSFQLRQLVDTLVDPAEGLLLYAPWTIFGFLACARAFPSLSEDSRLARTMALPLFLFLIVLGSIGFGAGWCYGPRYWVAFLPWLALGTVEAMRRAGRYQRALCAVLVLFGVAIAIPGALRYPQLFHKPALDAWRGLH